MSEETEPYRSACQAPLPALALRGLENFNAGKYFEAHEYLEAAWRDEPGPVRNLYQGVLQVAVGYYHLRNGNFLGARKMFARSRKWLASLPAICQGIDVAQLGRDRDRVEAEMLLLGPSRLRLFNLSFLRPVQYQNQQEG